MSSKFLLVLSIGTSKKKTKLNKSPWLDGWAVRLPMAFTIRRLDAYGDQAKIMKMPMKTKIKTIHLLPV